MNQPSVFISYSHKDEEWKNRLVTHLGVLQKQGLLNYWEDRKIAIGQEWFAGIQTALDAAQAAILLISPDFLNSKFVLTEEVPAILQRRMQEGMKVFPVIARSCSWPKIPWLSKLQARPTDGKPLAQFAGDDVDAMLSALVNEVEEILTAAKGVLPVPRPFEKAVEKVDCPYLGLDAFTENHAHLFFGREEFARDIFQKIHERSFVAVVGPSGSGKSSVVQAGVFPKLRDGNIHWETMVLQPQDSPFLSLAAEFVSRWQPKANRSVAFNATNKLASELKAARSIASAVQQTFELQQLQPDSSRLLLVVDQFEELFTLSAETERKPFVEALLAATQTAPVNVVVTLRADFYGQAISLTTELSQLIQNGIVNHRPLTTTDWESVILRPAEQVGLQFEPKLVAEILREVESQPDSLPLLEYALKELWQRSTNRTISFAQYADIGRIEGAINTRANEVLAKLTPEQQELALSAMTRLVRVSINEEDGADTRRRALRNEFSAAEWEVLQDFVNDRLLVTNRSDATKEEIIEVAHEALIRRWEKLQEAVDKDRKFLRWKRLLGIRIREWEDSRRDDGALLHGILLEEAKQWMERKAVRLTQKEKDFITWAERPEYQIEQILAKASDLLPLADRNLKDWFWALLFCYGAEQSLLAAQKIEHEYFYTEAIRAIAQGCISFRRFEQALPVARMIKNSEYQSATLRAISQGFINISQFNQALLVAREIKDVEAQAHIMQAIAQGLISANKLGDAQNLLKEALLISRNIKKADVRTKAMQDIAQGFVSINKLNDALLIAREIQEAEYRAYTMQTIAQELVKANKLQEALTVAHEIKDSHFQAQALQVIAQGFVKLGKFEEALYALREIEQRYFSAKTMQTIAQGFIRANRFEEALLVVDEIERIEPRAEALRVIAQDFIAANRLEDALTVAREIKDIDSKAQVIHTIVLKLSEINRLEQARDVAEKIEPLYIRADAMLVIAQGLIKVSNIEKALELFEEALKTAQRIRERDKHLRTKAMQDIAQGFVSINKLNDALLIARKTKEADAREQIMQVIAQKLGALNKFEEAFFVAREIIEEYRRTKTMQTIAQELVKANKLQEALTVAHEIKDSHFQAQALQVIAQGFVKLGKFEEALYALREIEQRYPRTEALRIVAQGFIRANRFEEALLVVDEIERIEPRAEALRVIAQDFIAANRLEDALTVAREIKDIDSQAQIIQAIAQGFVSANKLAAAAELFEESLTSARKIKEVELQSQAIRVIAQGFVSTNKLAAAAELFEESLTSARNIRDSYSRTTAMYAIAYGFVSANRFQEAFKVIEEIKDIGSRTQVIQVVAQGVIQADPLEEVLMVMREVMNTALGKEVMRAITQGFISVNKFDESLRAAEEIKDAGSRAQLLLDILFRMYRTNTGGKISDVISNIRAVLIKIYDEEERSNIAVKFAIILAEMRRYAHAREIADKYCLSSDRLGAYAAILREYHIECDPSLAQYFTKEN